MKHLFLSLATLLVLSGCGISYQYASFDPNLKIENDLSSSLKEKNVRYWEYSSKKEFDKTYEMELPHLRFQKSLEWYKSFNAGNRQGYKVTLLSINVIDDTRAITQNRYEDDEGNSHVFEDRWVFVENEWYHYFEFSKLPGTQLPF